MQPKQKLSMNNVRSLPGEFFLRLLLHRILQFGILIEFNHVITLLFSQLTARSICLKRRVKSLWMKCFSIGESQQFSFIESSVVSMGFRCSFV